MANNDSIKKTITVAALLCLVCSVVVSTAAVMLRDAQKANKQLDFNRNILASAGMLQEGVPVAEQFKQVTTRLVNMETGRFTTELAGTELDAEKYDQRRAAKTAGQFIELADESDIAKIGSMAKVAKVYLVEKDGQIEKVILPIKGYGLWSTLYGFIALQADLNTVIGISFYEHAETPGLGGEVDNPKWKALWTGKEVYSDAGDVAIGVIKGQAAEGDKHAVDGLSGATLTSRGVDNLVKFWMGESGYAKFLSQLKNGEA